MKRVGVLAFLVVVLVVFGAGSAGLLPRVPVLVQTDDPDSSVFMATPEQANQFFVFVIFLLVNLVGAGGTLALVMWFLGRATSHARSLPNDPPPFLNRPAKGESLPSGEAPTQLQETNA